MDLDDRSPTPPWRPPLLLRWLWRLIRDVLDEVRSDGIGDLAAAITFWTILSIPAAALAFISALGSLESVVETSVADDVRTDVEDYIETTFPGNQTLLDTVGELFDTPSRGLATIAMLVALFTLSRAFAGLIRALDIAYEVEDGRPWWYVRLVAIGLGVGTIVIVAAGATFLAILPSLTLSGVSRWLSGPAIVVGLALWAATVFHIGPNHRTPWRFDVPGAVFTAIGWVLATQGFALYVRFVPNGNNIQTSVGAVLLALTLMYLLSAVLLVGAELNDVLARRAGVVRHPRSVGSRARSVVDRLRSRTDPT